MNKILAAYEIGKSLISAGMEVFSLLSNKTDLNTEEIRALLKIEDDAQKKKSEALKVLLGM